MLLLENKKLDPSIDDNNIIKIASKYKCTDIIEKLLKHRRTDVNADDNYVFRAAIVKNNVELVKILLKDKKVKLNTYESDNDLVVVAVKNNNTEILKILLEEQWDPTGHKRIDPTIDNNLPFRTAVKESYIDIVKILMDDKRINIYVNNDEAILIAINNNCTKMVQLLLSR